MTKAELLELLSDEAIPDDARIMVFGSWTDAFSPSIQVMEPTQESYRGPGSAMVVFKAEGGLDGEHADLDYYTETAKLT